PLRSRPTSGRATIWNEELVAPDFNFPSHSVLNLLHRKHVAIRPEVGPLRSGAPRSGRSKGYNISSRTPTHFQFGSRALMGLLKMYFTTLFKCSSSRMSLSK